MTLLEKWQKKREAGADVNFRQGDVEWCILKRLPSFHSRVVFIKWFKWEVKGGEGEPGLLMEQQCSEVYLSEITFPDLKTIDIQP